MTRFIGAIVALQGVLSVVLWYGQPQEIPTPIALLGVLELLVAACLMTYRRKAEVDRAQGQIWQERQLLIFRIKQQFPLAAFQRVGVASTGASSRGNASYFVNLAGERHFGLPGYFADRQDAWAEARRVVAYLELPLDDRVRPSGAL